MPKKYCVPKCRGGYDRDNQVSPFRFPKQTNLVRIGTHHLVRQNFKPIEPSRVTPGKDQPEYELHQEIASTPKTVASSMRQQKQNFSCSSFIPKRYIFSFIGFLASTLSISLNTNLSMAIVSMVDRTNETVIQVKSSNECLSVNTSPFELTVKEKQTLGRIGEFHWNSETEGLALGAVYYGQLVGFLPGGRMAEVYGGKKMLIAFLFISSVCTVLTPIAARLSMYVFIACRFLIGVGTAPAIPILFYLISRWIPNSERSFNASFILAGYGVGTFISFLTAGVLRASDFLGGWPSVFYIGGICGFAWCLLCFIFIYETPKDHPTITHQELEFIAQNLGSTEQKKITNIPWKSIMLSVPFWSLAIGYCGQFWILGFYSTAHALYMGTILNLDIATNGALSCVPPLTRALFACLCGYPADWLLKRGYISIGFIRKGATLSNSIFSCAGFIAIILAGCDPFLNTVFFTIGGLLGDFVTFGVCMAGIDIAPNLSGTISGILSLVGVVPFFVIPALVGRLTKYERSMAQWKYVYFSTIIVIALTTLVYIFFGTSEPQSWGIDNEDRSKPDQEENIDHNEKVKKEGDGSQFIPFSICTKST